jgi:predicted nucleotidyltransferase/predicted transcriptional regulator
MNIDAKSMICGIPALDTRKLVRSLCKHNYASVGVIEHFSGFDSKKSLIILESLQQCGYIEEREDKEDKNISYSITTKGVALAMASAAKPFKRKSVERVFKEFMSRVEEINANDNYLHKVSKVIVFGSYLGTKEYLSDLDLAVTLTIKIDDPIEFRLKHNELVERAIESGINFPDFYYQANYSYHKTFKYLKNRSRIISLHEIARERGFIEKLDHKVVFNDSAK